MVFGRFCLEPLVLPHDRQMPVRRGRMTAEEFGNGEPEVAAAFTEFEEELGHLAAVVAGSIRPTGAVQVSLPLVVGSEGS